MKKAAKDLTIKLNEYNNKSRKGLYIYIKAEKRPTRLYKYNGKPAEIDATRNYYEDTYIKRTNKNTSRKTYITTYEEATTGKQIKKGTPKKKQVRRKADQYLKRIRKTRKIETAIKRGIASVNITDIQQTGPKTLEKNIKKLLSQLVLDKQLINILSTDHNLQKIKQRFEYQINLQNENRQTIATMTKFNEQPKRIQQELKNTLKKGEEIITEQYGSYARGNVINKLKEKGWHLINSYTEKGGTLQHTKTKVLFRK